MQKVALKAFLYSFSVSMLAISVANKAFLYKKNVEDAPLEVSKKNISLFIKELQPQKYPVKKINLTSLEPTETLNPSVSTANQKEADDGIIIADELEFDDNFAVADATIKDFREEDEDQKIFLAEVVYSADKPLEKLVIDEKEIYSPEVKEEEKVAVPKVEPQAIVYADISQETPVSLPISAPKSDNAPIPISYDQQSKADVKIKEGNPSDLNHVALKSGNVPIESMEKEISTDSDSKEKSHNWRQMRDNPWVVARSNGVAKNQMADKDFAHLSDDDVKKALNTIPEKDGIKVAAETVKNLIIPLPEKLSEDENLTPRLAYPEESEDAKKEKRIVSQEKNKKLLTEIDDEELPMEPPEEEFEDEGSSKTSLGKMLTDAVQKSKDAESNVNQKAKTKKQKARRNLRRAAMANRLRPITPKEIKMSFQANRAEISGHTLRWVQAFAVKAAQEDNVYLEVRIDGTKPTLLQQRRLNLLYNILTNKGVEYSKINVVFTSRDPNSFVLRMVGLDGDGKSETKKSNSDNNYVQW